jgi:hypothetical protein
LFFLGGVESAGDGRDGSYPLSEILDRLQAVDQDGSLCRMLEVPSPNPLEILPAPRLLERRTASVPEQGLPELAARHSLGSPCVVAGAFQVADRLGRLVRNVDRRDHPRSA